MKFSRTAVLMLAIAAGIGVSLPNQTEARKNRVTMRASSRALKQSGRGDARGGVASRAPGIAAPEGLRDSLARDIGFAGYERTASATREAFLVVNDSQKTLAGVFVTLTYRDMKGRMLHRRGERIAVEIPSGETRRVEIMPFAKGRNYYYHAGDAPRSGNAVAYDVTLRLDSVYLPR